MESNQGLNRFIVWMVFAVLVVLADQATKEAIIRWVPLYGDVAEARLGWLANSLGADLTVKTRRRTPRVSGDAGSAEGSA